MVPDHEPAAARYATNPGPDVPAQLRPFTSALTQESVALPSKDFPSIMRQGQPMAIHSEVLPEATIVVDVPMAAGRLRNPPSPPEPHFHWINSSMESKTSEVSSVNMQTDPDEQDDPADSICLPSQPRDQKIMHRPLDPRPKPPQVVIEGKHNLNFIVENKDGEVDLDNKLPSVERTTVAAFLQIFSEKSGIKIDDSVETLSFTLEFNDDVTLFLRQSDSEEVWGIIKGRIKNLFRRAVKKQPEKTRFIVWVNALERQ
jgi:hypothetical protein